MKKFLLVEDSPIVSKIIKHVCKTDLDLQFDLASTFKEAQQLIASNGKDAYLVAVVDLNLPDAPSGEVVDYTIEQGMPTIVLTGDYDEEKRDQMLEKSIVDYVVKESRFSYDYVVKLIKRLHKNQSIKILVADDSKMSRNYISNLLKTHLFQVETAEDGETALAAITRDPEIRLLITDYNMPNMNGFDLVKNIRKDASKNNLVIVGLSGEGNGKLSAKFIKNGANDFLAKPFSHEEFYCRILQDIENMEHLETMRHMAYHDYVTNLPNKRFFIENGAEELAQAQKNKSHTSLAIISIDNIYALQNQYGLDATEQTMKALASLMPTAFSRFTYAKVSDAEIAVLMVGLNAAQAIKLLESFRSIVEDHIVMLAGSNFNFTISAGVTSQEGLNLMDMLKQADNNLFTARDEGANQVSGDY